MALTNEQIQERYGISPDTIEVIDEQAMRGVLPGEPGEISVGRPLKFGRELKKVTFKETPENIAAMDAAAEALGMTRSDYVRSVVRRDLAGAASA